MKHIKTFEEFVNESVNGGRYIMPLSDFSSRLSELKDDYEEDFWNPSIKKLLSGIKNNDKSVQSIIKDKISKVEKKLKGPNNNQPADKEEIELYKMQIQFLKKISTLKSNNIDYEEIADDLESIAQQKESLRPDVS